MTAAAELCSCRQLQASSLFTTPLPQHLELNIAMGCSRTRELHVGASLTDRVPGAAPGLPFLLALEFPTLLPGGATLVLAQAADPAPPSDPCLGGQHPPRASKVQGENPGTPGEGSQGADYFL